MLPKKYQRGIVDPLSLVALGFLVVSIFVGTAVVSKKGFNFDIREKAKVIGECERDSDCDSGYYCKTGGPITYCEVKPITLKTATPAPQKTPTPAPAKTPTPAATPQVCANDGKCIGPGDVCCSGNDYFDNTCPVTETRCGTKASPVAVLTPTPAPIATPYCVRYYLEYCTSGCEPTTTGGKCIVKATPSVTPVPPTTTPIATPYCTRLYAEDCIYGCEPTSQGGKCKSAPVATPKPTPFCSFTNTQYCVYGCEPSAGGGFCKLAPSPTPTPKPELALLPSPAPIPFCSLEKQRICAYGCDQTPTGGVCIKARTIGQTCQNDFECESLNCQSAPGGKYCVPKGTSVTPLALAPSPTPVPSQEVLTKVGQFLNTITFGTFGDYVATYVELNQERPEATYLEKAFSQEGLAASGKLGTVLTAEGAVVYFGGAALAGAPLAEIPLSTTVVPAIEYASLYAYTAGSTIATTTLASAPSWVPTALRAGGVVAGNYGVYKGVRACEQDPASWECASLIATAQLGLLDDLARETGVVLDDLLLPARGATAQVAVVTLETGETITLGEQIGSGGFQGAVYRGQTCTGEICAVKILDPDSPPIAGLLDQEQLRILRTFAKPEDIAQSGLPSPAFYGTVRDEAGEYVGYAMEYVEGQTLLQVVEEGALTQQQAAQAAAALERFQQVTGQPHGDIVNFWEPKLNRGNIIFTSDRGAILIDPAGTAIAPIFSTEGLMQQELQKFGEYLELYMSP